MTAPTIPRDCAEKTKCRLSYGPGASTCMGWHPVYDGHGNAINHDPNYTTSPVNCSTCGGRWIETRHAGAITWALDPPHQTGIDKP